jgi:hypothetical protein
VVRLVVCVGVVVGMEKLLIVLQIWLAQVGGHGTAVGASRLGLCLPRKEEIAAL